MDKMNNIPSVRNFQSFNEVVNTKSPYDDITYHIEGNYIIVKRKDKEFYHIDRSQLTTEKSRLEWLAHMSEKNWCYAHDFRKALMKAKSKWDLQVKATFAKFPSLGKANNKDKNLYIDRYKNIRPDARDIKVALDSSDKGRCWWIYKYLMSYPFRVETIKKPQGG